MNDVKKQTTYQTSEVYDVTYDLKTPQITNRQTQKGKKCNIKQFKSAENTNRNAEKLQLIHEGLGRS